MSLKSFSKINLSLSVSKKIPYKKKYLHNIQSYFCMINLYDKIKIKKINSQEDKIKFHGKFAHQVNKKNNSVKNVLKILRRNKLISNYYSISINKNIPAFAGLGGGTSNAFYIAKHFTKGKINKKLSAILNQKIGSDFKLFFHKEGFLENIKNVRKLKNKYKLNFLLVYPNLRCSTKYVYSKVKEFSKKLKHNPNMRKNKRTFINELANKNNDLQLIVEKKFPIIKKLIFEISKKKGCYFSRMTGSGSLCYGIFNSDKTAKGALNKVKSKYPKYWISLAKTI